MVRPVAGHETPKKFTFESKLFANLPARPNFYSLTMPRGTRREVCAAAYQGRVACYEAESGRQIWGRELSSVTGVSLDARYAFWR